MIRFPFPKHGVQSPPCPYRPLGSYVRLARTYGPPQCHLLCVSLWIFVLFVVRILWQSCVRQHAPNLPQSAKSALPPHWQSSCTFVVLRVLRECRVASGFIAARGGGSGFNLCGSSKPLNLQTSKLLSALFGARDWRGGGNVRGM